MKQPDLGAKFIPLRLLKHLRVSSCRDKLWNDLGSGL